MEKIFAFGIKIKVEKEWSVKIHWWRVDENSNVVHLKGSLISSPVRNNNGKKRIEALKWSKFEMQS
jgi:hypothetical protein